MVYCWKICNDLIFHLDIDECVQGLAGCDHNCTNTNGSYYCTCMDGYALESDNHTCIGNDCCYEKDTSYVPYRLEIWQKKEIWLF